MLIIGLSVLEAVFVCIGMFQLVMGRLEDKPLI
jgi:hypothetical protein